MDEKGGKTPTALKLPPTATPESRRSLESQGGITPWVCDLCNVVFGSAQASRAPCPKSYSSFWCKLSTRSVAPYFKHAVRLRRGIAVRGAFPPLCWR